MKKTKPLCMIAGILSFSLLNGCGQKESQESETVWYAVRVEFENYTEDTRKEELLTFYGDNGRIYNAFDISEDGIVEADLPVNECKVVSHVLEKSLVLPKTDVSHEIVIRIDYDTGEVSAELEDI